MHVVLVGAEFEENLAVRYLRGALEHAGHRVTQIVFNEADDIDRAAREVVDANAPLVGLSMVFTYRAREFVRLATRARELGYRGHVVAGGHFAAFHPTELLRDAPAIDSVAIGEGEDLLCELTGNLGNLGAVRGLVFRQADQVVRNAPAAKPPDLDRLPWPPRKQPLDDYLGLPITNLLGSRGCGYSCTFCSIVAWHRLTGGERVRMRSVESVADEMAALYHSGARIFNFHDDNFFVDEKSEMLSRVAALGAALEQRRVGRIAFAIKARPGAVDEEIFRALVARGLFRVFLGIEAGTPEALKRLGRRQTVEENERALEVVNRLGIHTAFNVLLFNPDSTLEDVRDNVAFLGKHPHNPTNFCRTEIYAGTPLETKLRREGRLRGSYFGWDYCIADPRAQLCFELAFHAFRTRNYGPDCLHHAAMALDYEHQLLAHFQAERADLRARVKDLVVTVNLDTCRHLDEIIERCALGFDSPEARSEFERRIAAAVEAQNRRLGAAANALLDEIRAGVKQPVTRGWTKTARAVSLAASMSLAATACKKSGDDSHPTEMVAAPPTQPYDAPPPPDAASDAGVGPADASPSDAANEAEATGAPGDAAPGPDAARDAGKKPVPTGGTHRHEMVPRPRLPTHPSEMAPAPPDDE